MFEPVPNELDFPQIERRILKFWKERDFFDKLRKKNAGRKKFSFLDGPITANNPQGMGVHHAWGRTYKDLYQRYKAMTGHDLRYQNGFDCQGLWVEVEVEKELGFTSKKDIEAYGIAPFIEKCKERVRRSAQAVVEQSIRLGQWMDWDHSYWTMSDENNYTIWMFLRKCHDKGWIYKGHDVMPWCARCGTAISEHEIATEGYKELTHRSVFLTFPLTGREDESLLIWTTTPWTLTSNVAAAVHPELMYVKVRQDNRILYLSKGALSVLEPGYEVLEEIKGAAMVGWRYQGPFDDLDAQRGVEHPVIPWKEVSEEEGTGIVHIAPGCGKEDFALSKEYNLSVIAPLNEAGIYVDGFNWLTGREAADVAEDIFEDLERKGVLYKTEDYTHRYPVCWRCDTELVFRLVDEWFISMDTLRHQIMEVAKKVTWMPAFGLARELDWLRNMHDWCISKKRYWGLALPIYECACGYFEVIGSEDELKERAVEGWKEFEGQPPHRPWIDAVKIECPRCGAKISRIPDVGNPWLDAGIVPYSTLNYRHDRAYWKEWFPAEFITECFPGQFRNWFYALLAMSTVMENRTPFLRILGHALVHDEHGEEMHKSKGNAIWFDEAADRMGADVMRWMFAGSNPVGNIHFGFGPAEQVKRKLLTLWHSYSFFVTYARLDGFDPTSDAPPVEGRSVLDRWLTAKVNALVRDARNELERYNAMAVVKVVEAFLEDLSNWYIRRSRRRFWKSESDSDKAAAYSTLYETLVTLVRVIAPIMPFFSEEIYQNLTACDPSTPESVHLCDYPEADETLLDEALMEDMALVMRIVSLGRAARKNAGLKVRQPLSEIRLVPKASEEPARIERLKEQITEELNVKEVVWVEDPTDFVDYVIRPNFRLLGAKYGRDLPAIRTALEALDPEDAAERVEGGSQIMLSLNGREIALLPEEVVVETKPKEGLSVTEEDGYVAALNTELTEVLEDEGFARELVHRIQNMRKEAGFEVSDRIALSYRTTPRLEQAISAFRDFIQAETLCLKFETADDGDFTVSEKINGQEAWIAISKVVSNEK
ncbi:MAG: isoleucine--tRNA ligase [Candidatus Latescibacteria bacterium 4484_107]|nr:MAG: isoleucine--tRNA ligase [Candidatus Latescibacteria bacterium 4484_107]